MVSIVAKKYAEALFSVAKENGIEEKVFAELKSCRNAFLQSEARVFFSSPLQGSDKKMAVIKGWLSKLPMSDILKNFFLLLADKGRLGAVKDIVEAYQTVLDKDRGIIRGHVQSSEALDNESLAEIQTSLENKMQAKLVLETSENSELIAGILARVGSVTIDNSLASQLRRLKEELRRVD